MARFTVPLLLAIVVLGLLLASGTARADSTFPSFTDKQRAAVGRLVQHDQALKDLLAPRGFTVSAVPWYGAAHELLGGVATLHLSSSDRLSGTWRLTRFDTATGSFSVQSTFLTVAGVSDIRAFVDLDRHSVVGFTPDDQATIETPSSGRTRSQQPEGLFSTNPPLLPSGGTPAASGSTPYVLPPPGDGGSTVDAIFVNGNRQFYNWDFNTQSVSASNADWPVNLIFMNNANIDRVKNGLAGKYDQGGSCASAMNDRVGQNFNAMVWDSDQGRKYTCCPVTGGTTHFRIYADHDDSPHRLYAPDFGYYVVGTSHRDVEECSPWSGPYAGWSEDAEYEVGSDSVNVGWGLWRNFRWMSNAVTTSWIGSRYYQSNGYATRIFLP